MRESEKREECDGGGSGPKDRHPMGEVMGKLLVVPKESED